MTANEIRGLKLSPAMRTALMCTAPEDLMAGGPTRAALMRRGLVFGRKSRPDRLGKLTTNGLKVRDHLRAEAGW